MRRTDKYVRPPRSSTQFARCSLTKAAASVVGENKTGLAGTLEAAGGVGARAKLADVRLHITLVDVWEGSGTEGRGGRREGERVGVHEQVCVHECVCVCNGPGGSDTLMFKCKCVSGP